MQRPSGFLHLRSSTLDFIAIDEMTDIDELKRLLKVCQYERGALQTRLNVIRVQRDRIIRLLDMPTLEEHLEAGGDVLDYIGGKRGKKGKDRAS